MLGALTAEQPARVVCLPLPPRPTTQRLPGPCSPVPSVSTDAPLMRSRAQKQPGRLTAAPRPPVNPPPFIYRAIEVSSEAEKFMPFGQHPSTSVYVQAPGVGTRLTGRLNAPLGTQDSLLEQWGAVARAPFSPCCPRTLCSACVSLATRGCCGLSCPVQFQSRRTEEGKHLVLC